MTVMERLLAVPPHSHSKVGISSHSLSKVGSANMWDRPGAQFPLVVLALSHQ